MKQCRLLNCLQCKRIILCKIIKGQTFGVIWVKVVSNWVFWPLCPRTSSHESMNILAFYRLFFCQSVSIKCRQESREKAESLSVMLGASLVLLNGLTVLLLEGKDFKLKHLKISLKSLWFCFVVFFLFLIFFSVWFFCFCFLLFLFMKLPFQSNMTLSILGLEANERK